MKKILSLLSIVFLFSCQGGKKSIQTGKLNVITTIFPLYDFSRQVGQDKVNVILLLPPGVEAHSYEPTPKDMALINEADMLIYTGKDMEVWIDDVLSGIKNNNKLLIVDTSQGIELLGLDHDHHGQARRSIHNKDPHIWLDPLIARKMVNTITRSFIRVDPVNKDFYMKNSLDYIKKLTRLNERIRSTLARCKHRIIIHGGHFAFRYFVKRYGLTYMSPYKGFAPDAEPTSHNISELIEWTRKTGIKYIFYEELLEPRVARVLSEETGTQLLLLHAVHNVSKKELKKGVAYISLMEDNLERLKKALDYQNGNN